MQNIVNVQQVYGTYKAVFQNHNLVREEETLPSRFFQLV